MPLLPPTVLAPITTCNAEIMLQGLVTGANVEITATSERGAPQIVARGRAASSDQSFRLTTGIILTEGQFIKAKQSLGSDGALESGDGIRVMPAPSRAMIRPLVWMHKLTSGGRCIWLEGAWPGGIIEIKSGGEILAREQTASTIVRMSLNRHVRSGEVLTATQKVCDVEGQPANSEPALPLPDNAIIPPPRVESPLFACERRITVSDVTPGSTVRILRNSAPSFEGCFDAPSLYVPYSEMDGLRTGETITARQGYPDLGRWSAPFDPPVTVLSARSIPVPQIVQPLCGITDRIVVTDLVPDAIVRIYRNGREIGYRTAVAATDAILIPTQSPPLTSGDRLSAQQELCRVRSRMSPEVKVETPPEPVTPIVTTPSECSPVVHITKLWPGSRVRLVDRAGNIYANTTALTHDLVLHVPTLSLNRGYKIEASSGCGSRLSPTSADVLPARTPTVPVIAHYVLHSDRDILVNNVQSGSFVDIYVKDPSSGDETLRGTAPVFANEVKVPIMGRLQVDDIVLARQRACGRSSPRPSAEEKVRRCHHTIRVGVKSVSLNPGFIADTTKQLDWMRKLYRYHGFDVQILELEWIDNRRFLTVNSRVGSTWRPLVSHRDGLTSTDIAIYYVETISPGYGFYFFEDWVICRAHAIDDTTAHEIGHALGIADHVRLPGPNPCGTTDEEKASLGRRLMFGDPPCSDASRTSNAGNGPIRDGRIGTADEALIPSEVDLMKRSRFAIPYLG